MGNWVPGAVFSAQGSEIIAMMQNKEGSGINTHSNPRANGRKRTKGGFTNMVHGSDRTAGSRQWSHPKEVKEKEQNTPKRRTEEGRKRTQTMVNTGSATGSKRPRRARLGGHVSSQ